MEVRSVFSRGNFSFMLYMYIKLVYVWGGGRGYLGPSQENFAMKGYKSCKSDRYKFGLSIREKVFVFYF